MANICGGARFCSVCQCSFNSEAELAIHEYSKKHCDNLIRLSKNKPVKTKTPKPVINNNERKVGACEVVPQPVNLSLYGYFNQNDMLSSQPKEFNTEYDPYLQKLAENPYKLITEKEVPATATGNVTSFSRNKKKKKKSCQICNVSMMNIPQYEAHMKSPLHIYKLRSTGMGVSAHFVKASTNLHTIDKEEESPSQSAISFSSDVNPNVGPVPMAPSELFCDVCGVLLNSTQQFQAHLIGKTHLDNVLRKQSVQTPSPGQLFCYTCKLSLTNLLQFNEHKNGKKHRAKCKTLLREGITIPPEERPVDMIWNIVSSSQTIYPDGYKKEVVEKQVNIAQTPKELLAVPKTENNVVEKQNISKVGIIFHNEKSVVPKMEFDVNTEPNEKKLENQCRFECTLCENKFPTQPPFEMHLNSEEHALKLVSLKKSGLTLNNILSKLMKDRIIIKPDRYNRYCCGICAIVSQNLEESERHLVSLVHKYSIADYTKKRQLEIVKGIEANDDKLYCCKLCEQSWAKLTEYNAHLHSQKHKSLAWKERQKKMKNRRLSLLQLKRLRSWRAGNERNPGVRTKIGGIAKDLNSGAVEIIPNLEIIEPKIDNSKNVTLGLSKISKTIKKKVTMVPARRRPGMVYRKLAVPPSQSYGVSRQPYISPLFEQPVAPYVSFNTPMLPPRVSHYNPFVNPNFVQPRIPRPFYQPMRPPPNWRPNYQSGRYY